MERWHWQRCCVCAVDGIFPSSVDRGLEAGNIHNFSKADNDGLKPPTSTVLLQSCDGRLGRLVWAFEVCYTWHPEHKGKVNEAIAP